MNFASVEITIRSIVTSQTRQDTRAVFRDVEKRPQNALSQSRKKFVERTEWPYECPYTTTHINKYMLQKATAE